MERKIGEIFEHNGEWYQCLEEKTCTCFGCGFREYNCEDISLKEVKGSCQSERRKDNKSVIFKKLEKVGEPYYDSDNKLCQQYKCYIVPLITDEIVYVFADNRVVIEIKQNKEDMEEKTNKASKKIELNDLVNEYINELIDYDEFEKGIIEWSVKYSNLENIGKNLKPFDLNSAKAGKLVYTRDGRKARIICFDLQSIEKTPIVAAVQVTDKQEVISHYYEDGRQFVDGISELDLMMLPEKKEGWINIYRNEKGEYWSEQILFRTKKDATDFVHDHAQYVTTVKAEWEE